MGTEPKPSAPDPKPKAPSSPSSPNTRTPGSSPSGKPSSGGGHAS